MKHAEFAELVTSHPYLADCQYSSSDNLRSRQSIYRYLDPPIDFRAWALDLVSWSGGECVLDVGCGNGLYLRSLKRDRGVAQVLGLDLSEGMIRELGSAWKDNTPPLLAVADAANLPLESARVDVVLAMHMLYHVPDMELAVREFRRVLHSGGTLLVATNSNRHFRELTSLYLEAVESVSGRLPEAEPSSGLRFKLGGSGQRLLRGAFDKVVARELEGTLRIPLSDAITDYIASARTHREPFLPPGASWEAVMQHIQRNVEETITHYGFFEISTHSGVYVCQAGT